MQSMENARNKYAMNHLHNNKLQVSENARKVKCKERINRKMQGMEIARSVHFKE